MKKKKVKSDGDSTPVVDLKALIHQHSLFFDKLVELIPARFYLLNNEDKPWFEGLSKEKKGLMKKETKEKLKTARRDRLNPEKASTTTLDLLKQNLEKENQDNKREDDDDDNDENDDDEMEKKNIFSGLDDENRSVTYEELRQRLHRRIEEFRDSRSVGCSKREQKKNERSERRGAAQQQKRKKVSESGEKVLESGDNSSRKREEDIGEAVKGLSFGHVKLGDDDEHGKNRKRRKLSKQQELEKAKELQEAKKDPEKGETFAEKHSWSAATSRAAGVKVHDNPRLLSKSIQKEKRQQQKNAQKWKERVQTTNKMKAERQKKRTDNIQSKKDKRKQKKIEKREKKLLKPGFAGRKEGFINEGTS